MTGYRGYIFSRPFQGERVPQHVQNLVIRDYCQKGKLAFLLSAAEYAMPDCHLIWHQILDDLPNLDGIVAYSLYQLPQSKKDRLESYRKILAVNKSLHFAVEGMQVFDNSSSAKVEQIWEIHQAMEMGRGA